MSQDTIAKLLLDRQGFLWLGTHSGLNRFDGYRVEQIEGKKFEIADADIEFLFEDSLGQMWVSTGRMGVFRLNLDSLEIRQIADNGPGAGASARGPFVHIGEAEPGRVLLTSHKALWEFDLVSTHFNPVFSLGDQNRYANLSMNQAVRWDGIILVASDKGLLVVTMSEGQNDTKQADVWLLPMEAEINGIQIGNEGKLWMGTKKGLYSVDLSVLRQGSHDNKAIQAQLHLPDVAVNRIFPSQGSYFLATDQGLFIYMPEHGQTNHLLRFSDSRLYLSRDRITDLIQDRQGNFWLGSEGDGAMYWSALSGLFVNVHDAVGAQRQLSDNFVKSLAEHANEHQLWVGTDNGLNLFDLRNHELAGTWLEGTEYRNIRQIAHVDGDRLLLRTSRGLLYLYPGTGHYSSLKATDPMTQALFDAPISGVHVDADGDIWFSNHRQLFRYSPESGQAIQVSLGESKANEKSVFGFIGHYPGQPDQLMVSAEGALWVIDRHTKQSRLIHRLNRAGDGTSARPESAILDERNILWIAYPRFGLVGIDQDSLVEQYVYTKRDILPTNLIYGLNQDKDNNIWMSSHAGLLKLYPDSQYVQQYSVSHGLLTKEFNALAHLTLSDGRLVYGSMKGFTLFDPQDFSSHDDLDVAITSLNLSSRPLNMPLRTLSGQSIELSHNDVGLAVGFSTLAFEHLSTTLYRYTLSGPDSFSPTASAESQVIFPKLSAGDYEFSVVAYDPIDGKQSAPAKLNIVVAHAPWASPLAYTFYLLMLVALIFLWWYRNNKQNVALHAAHAEAVKSKNRLSSALIASNSNVWEWWESKQTFYAPRVSGELGYRVPSNEITLEHHLTLIHREDRNLFETKWQSFLNDPQTGLDVTYRMGAKSGAWHWYRDVGSLVSGTADNGQVVAGTYSNITESLANREKVRLFGEAFKHTRDWVMIFDGKGRAVAINQALGDAFAVDEQGDLNAQLTSKFKLDTDDMPDFWRKFSQLKPGEHWKGEERLVVETARLCHVLHVLVDVTLVASVQRPNEADYYLVIMSDISEQKHAEHELRRLANFDSLTNLPNRPLLLDRIKHAIDHANRHQTSVGLFFIDLDRFKQVNDSLGHDAGDELLKVVAQRLTNLLRQNDTVARLGGDEFVVMVEDVKQGEKLSLLAKEMIQVLEEPVKLGHQTVSVSSSIGIALYPNDADSSEALLHNADLAMYHAKEQGSNNFQYFTEYMNHQAQARLLLENQLKQAFQGKCFVNYYQPIVNSRLGCVEGFELLMRWPTDEGMIPPDVFIPIAEELGLIEDMTWHALEQAMPLLSAWQKAGREVYLSVNLSARHFAQQIAIEQLVQLLEQHQLPVSALRFEITESALMKDYERAQKYMQNMQKLGFIIALDDFGTGYSSLKYLKEFPIQVLKVDKSFVEDIDNNESSRTIVLTILRMADSLGMKCIAEGIEELAQMAFFARHGCEHLQGYFFSKPVPAKDTVALLDKTWQA